jgi:hypothetical protein
MNQDERQKKHELLNKIAGLVKLASSLGTTIEDEQTIFIAESFKLILIAGSDPESARLLSDHLVNYIDEVSMLKGEVNAQDHLKDKAFQLN